MVTTPKSSQILHVAARAVLVGLLLSAPVGAAELSLSDALARAEIQSPLIRRAVRERGVVAASRVGAGLRMPYNPVLGGFVGSRTDRSGALPAATGIEWGLRLEQPFEIAGQRRARLSEAARALEVALLEEHAARVETRALVRVQYVDALLAEAQASSARELEKLGTQLFESAKKRVEMGAASDVELKLAETESGRLSYERMEAELRVQQTRIELGRFLGLDLNAPLNLTTPLTRPEEVRFRLDELLRHAQTRRIELRIVAATRSRWNATAQRLRREVIPNPSLSVDYQRQQPRTEYIGAGLGVQIPLWQRNQGSLAVTKAELERTQEEAQLVDRQIAAELTTLYHSVETRRRALDVWEKQIVPAAAANVELVTQGWKAGKFDLFRVIQVTQQAAESQRKRLEVLHDLWQTAIDLDRARGAL